jgi:hypothetical protein
LADFIHNVALPAIGLKNDFETLKKELMTQQKSAHDVNLTGIVSGEAVGNPHITAAAEA